MEQFLKAVATQYATHYGDNISNICFVFPNKRSGTFFLKYHKEIKGNRVFFIPPAIRTLSAFAEELSGYVVDNHIDLLLTLFNCYKKLANLKDSDPRNRFDTFRSWGELILKDFDEVDRYGDCAEDIFKNIKDLSELSTDFLSDEQKEVLSEVFGMEYDYNKLKGSLETFWKSVYKKYEPKEDDEDAEHIDIKGHFLSLWEILSDLYTEFNNELMSRGLTYQGAAYRLALAKLKRGEVCLDPDICKYVFVGFYDIHPMERKMFETLSGGTVEIAGREEPAADFVWDFTGLAASPKNTELNFMRQNIKMFPQPEWLDLSKSNCNTIPETLNLISCPSNSLQVKEIGNLIKQLADDSKGKEAMAEARVAVVLPDENLLLPLLYSLPSENEDTPLPVNLTMGYPLKLTGTISFIGLLRRLRKNCRKKGATKEFLFTDVQTLLSHPFVREMLTEEETVNIRAFLKDNSSFVISGTELGKFSDVLDLIFNNIDYNAPYEEVYKYIDGILERVGRAIADNKENSAEALEDEHIELYREAHRRLYASLQMHKVEISGSEFLSLADNMLAGETVSFVGEPISGLQIVGFLETRCLDFDRIIIPSMNERILPSRYRHRTFIPASVRKGFGLPTASEKESRLSYLFYRMISRAKRVDMLYDARTGSLKSGDLSRYVLQLQYLYAPDKVNLEELRYSVNSSEEDLIVIEKDDKVMEALERYKASYKGDKKNLSPTGLQKYISCPVRFYYFAVLGIGDNPEPSDYIDAAGIGKVLHKVMEDAYVPNKADKHKLLTTSSILVDQSQIDNLINHGGANLEKLIVDAIKTEYLELDPSDPKFTQALTGELAIMMDTFKRQLTNILKNDYNHAPFTIYGCEVKKTIAYQPEGMDAVNFKITVDRIDCLNKKIGETTIPDYRIVDYKSGKVHFDYCKVEDLFDNEKKESYSSQNLFQLMTYAIMLKKFKDDFPAKDIGYNLVIYSTYDPVENVPKILDSETSDKIEFKSHLDIADEFTKHLDRLINEIFDKEKPFIQTANTTTCSICNYKRLCKMH